MKGGRLRFVVLPATAGVLALGALLWFTAIGQAKPTVTNVSATLVDAGDHNVPVVSTPPATSPPDAAPGSFVAIKVTATLASGEAWRSTSYAFGSGSQTCDNDANRSTAGTHTEYVDATLPETTPTPGSVTVRLYAADGCTGNALGTAESTFKIREKRTNPFVTPHCDTRVALVLDESGSIGSTSGAQQAVISGSKAFVNGLVDSGARLAVIDFNSSARTVSLSPDGVYNNVTSAFASGPFASYINGQYDPSGWTNWQDAFVEVGFLSPMPELVVFLTDGDPTARNPGPDTGFPNGSYLAMNPAFTEANGARQRGIHVFAIGVGAALTNANSKVRLRAISGPKAFPEHPLLESDYTVVSDFRQLEEALATIGRALCSVRARVTKLVDEEGDGTYAPANAWKFDGTVTVSGTPAAPDSYRWLVPGTETGPPSGGNTRTATTADDFTGDPGRAAFVWKPSPTTRTSQIRLADLGKTGYHFVSVSCSKNGNAITVPNTATIDIAGLAITDYVDCVFRNQRNVGKLTVEKRFIGQPVEVSLLIDGKQKAKSADASFGTGPVTVDVGSHGVSEEFTNPAHAALFESRYVCAAGGVILKQGDGVQVTGGIDVSNGASIVCTFTNTRKTLSVAVAKDADPGSVDQPGGEVRFTVAVVNRTPAGVTVTALHDDVFGDLDKDSPAASHSWTASNCDAGVPLAAYDGSVGGADTYTCSFAGNVTGAAGTTHRDTVTATITDASGETASEKATAKVEIVDVRPSIAVTKTATPSVVQNSGLVTFTAVVTNTSPVDALLVDQLTDSIHGDLIRGQVKASCTYGGAPVTLPRSLPIGESFICTFRATVSATETDTVTASGTDPEGNRVADAAEALVTVQITPAPEPPIPPLPPLPPNPEPSPPVELTLHKSAPATVFLDADGRGSFVYEIRGSSTGAAPSATLRDVAPRGATFTRIIDQPAPGVCSISRAGKLLTCSGSLVAGQSYGVKVLASVTASGGTTITNTAFAACKPVPAALCVARASATTRLIGLFLPPSPCATLSVSPSSLLVSGQPQTLVARVRSGGRPVAGATVVVAGPAVRASANTGSTGVARITVTPTVPGVLTVSLRGERACSVQRVGIVAGSTLPSLTG